MKPLFEGFSLLRLNKKPAQISFKYEWLSEFCYGCGKLGHLQQACPIYTNFAEEPWFGQWMRAESQDLRRFITIH